MSKLNTLVIKKIEHHPFKINCPCCKKNILIAESEKTYTTYDDKSFQFFISSGRNINPNYFDKKTPSSFGDQFLFNSLYEEGFCFYCENFYLVVFFSFIKTKNENAARYLNYSKKMIDQKNYEVILNNKMNWLLETYQTPYGTMFNHVVECFKWDLEKEISDEKKRAKFLLKNLNLIIENTLNLQIRSGE